MKYALLATALVAACPVFAESLNEAVQHSMISNPEILFNRAKTLSARQGIDKAWGAFLPTVDITAGYGREKSDNPTTEAIEGNGTATLNRTESLGEMKQVLYAGGGIFNEWKRNQYLYQAQDLKTQGIAEDMALEVVNRYLLVILHEKLVRYAQRNFDEHRRVFSMIKARSDAGITRQAELDQADARMALAEANRISAIANLREAKINYAKVVGNWPGKLTWPRVPKRRELPSSLVKALEQGLDNHPTVRSTYADIKEAKAQYAVARAAYYPRFDFVLSASRNHNLDGLPGPNNDQMAMLRMNYNVYRGGSDDANVRQTAYEVQEAYEVKNRSLIDLRESIRLSWNAWEAATLRISPLKKHVTAAYETRSAYIEQFKVGKRTLLDTLDSQNEYYEAQIELARGINDEVYARYRILNGMGKLLPYLKMKLPLNVVNNDVFTSAENHILLNTDMDKVPYPDISGQPLVLDHPVKSMDKTRLTPAIVDKNAVVPIPPTPLMWYVSAGCFTNPVNAQALVARLRGLGFTVDLRPMKQCLMVVVGPYEFRGHAANGMERLKEIAHVQGILVTYRDFPPMLVPPPPPPPPPPAKVVVVEKVPVTK